MHGEQRRSSSGSHTATRSCDDVRCGSRPHASEAEAEGKALACRCQSNYSAVSDASLISMASRSGNHEGEQDAMACLCLF